MTLRVIGAGWGRTGTASMQIALERLGFPCHHMREVFSHPEHSGLFLEAATTTGPFDWERIYADYAATVDWPGCAFWRELAEAYPEAKVVLNVRDPQSWFDSYAATIYRPLTQDAPGNEDAEAWHAMTDEVVLRRSFDGDPHDRTHVTTAFQRHNEAVQAAIPAERLLVYSVAEGWEPLCAFLDRPVPDEPFPHVNDRASWERRHEADDVADDVH
jgi:hypothetical protein